MSNQFEDSQNPGHSNQSHDFSSFANNVEFRQVVKHKGEKVGQNGKQIHQVEGLDKEGEFAWSAYETDEVFQGEIYS